MRVFFIILVLGAFLPVLGMEVASCSEAGVPVSNLGQLDNVDKLLSKEVLLTHQDIEEVKACIRAKAEDRSLNWPLVEDIFSLLSIQLQEDFIDFLRDCSVHTFLEIPYLNACCAVDDPDCFGGNLILEFWELGNPSMEGWWGNHDKYYGLDGFIPDPKMEEDVEVGRQEEREEGVQENSQKDEKKLLDLPAELLEMVIFYLPSEDIGNLRLVCKDINSKTLGTLSYLKSLSIEKLIGLRIYDSKKINKRIGSIETSCCLPWDQIYFLMQAAEELFKVVQCTCIDFEFLTNIKERGNYLIPILHTLAQEKGYRELVKFLELVIEEKLSFEFKLLDIFSNAIGIPQLGRPGFSKTFLLAPGFAETLIRLGVQVPDIPDGPAGNWPRLALAMAAGGIDQAEDTLERWDGEYRVRLPYYEGDFYDYLLAFLAWKGDLRLVEILLEKLDAQGELDAHQIKHAFLMAVQGGNIAVVKFLYDYAQQRGWEVLFNDYAHVLSMGSFELAVYCGHVDILAFLFEKAGLSPLEKRI